MALLLTVEMILLTFITSTAATRDSRSCKEMIQGPLYYDSNFTQAFHFRVADENNTLTLRCRVICQEQGAYYTPHIRIITTKDGAVHDRRNDNLFSTDKSPLDNTCDPANRIRDYEFRITALNDMLNESIATCILFYRSRSENFTDFCYTPTLVWIILPDQPTTMTATTAMPTTTITTSRSTATVHVTTNIITQEIMISPTTPTGPSTIAIADITTPEVAQHAESVPKEVSYISIPVIGAICIFMIVLIAVAWFAYKKSRKTRKRKTSVQPSEEGGATVAQAHEGFYNYCKDIEEDELESMDDASKIGQHEMPTVKQRKSQN